MTPAAAAITTTVGAATMTAAVEIVATTACAKAAAGEITIVAGTIEDPEMMVAQCVAAMTATAAPIDAIALW